MVNNIGTETTTLHNYPNILILSQADTSFRCRCLCTQLRYYTICHAPTTSCSVFPALKFWMKRMGWVKGRGASRLRSGEFILFAEADDLLSLIKYS